MEPRHKKDCFFKYTTIETAKKILSNKTMRYSSSLLFNDPFDHQFDLQADFDEAAIREACLLELKNIHKKGDASVFSEKSPIGRMFRLFMPHLYKVDLQKFTSFFVDGWREHIAKLQQKVSEACEAARSDIKSSRILCVSETNDNILMWSHYSHKHTGVVFKLACIKDIDNTLLAARPVSYVKKLPAYASSIDFAKFATGQTDRLITARELVDYICYTKCIDWSYEQEWRVVIFDYDQSGALYSDLPESPKVIDAVYLGCNIDENDEMDLVKLIGSDSQLNHVDIYKARKMKNEFALEFDKLTL